MNYVAIYKVDRARNKKVSAISPSWGYRRKAVHYYRTDKRQAGDILSEALVLSAKPDQKMNFYRVWEEEPIAPGDVVVITSGKSMKTRYFMLLPSEWEEGLCKETLDGKIHDLEYVGSPS
jgi:hypothetical protein